jgi:hypothetical protein
MSNISDDTAAGIFAKTLGHLFIALTAFSASKVLATTANESTARVQQSATYRSTIDERLTIRKITVLPGSDNTDGIYARPLEAHLVSLVKTSHRWEFAESGMASLPKAPLDLEENPELVKNTMASLESDAAILPIITRGPRGLSLRLDLFLKADGKILAQEVLRDYARFELADVKAVVTGMYKRMIATVPYEGLLLSRQGTRVTMNLGKADGIREDQTVSVIQIIAESRHPKFGFLISTEKEVLGQVKVLKVDDTLSFGVITAEKERGAIRRLAKISGVKPIEYGEAQTLSPSNDQDVRSRPDSGIAFGEMAKEWLPAKPPSFGQIGIKVGLGTYTGSTNVTGVGSLDAKSDYFPMLGVSGELWLNPEWSVFANITQGILSTPNPRVGATPGMLNHALSKYSMALGYNFLFRDDFFGPKFQLKAGFNFYRMFVDDSTPQALTTVNYNGFLLGLGLYFPVSEQSLWAIGGDLSMTLFAKLTESPVSSADSASNTVNDFSLFLERKIAINLKARASLDFSLYSSSLSGAGTRAEPATSISQRIVAAGAGLIYQF